MTLCISFFSKYQGLLLTGMYAACCNVATVEGAHCNFYPQSLVAARTVQNNQRKNKRLENLELNKRDYTQKEICTQVRKRDLYINKRVIRGQEQRELYGRRDQEDFGQGRKKR